MNAEDSDISEFMDGRNIMPKQLNNVTNLVVNTYILHAKRYVDMFNWVDGKLVMFDAIPGTANPNDSFDDGHQTCIVSNTIKVTTY